MNTITKIKNGRYFASMPNGEDWQIIKMRPDLGGWKWMAWLPRPAGIEGPSVYGDTLEQLVRSIELAIKSRAEASMRAA